MISDCLLWLEVDYEFRDTSDTDTDSDYVPDSMDISSDFSVLDVSSDISMGSIDPGEVTQLRADAATQLDSAYTKLIANPLLLSKGNKKEWMSVHLATRGSRMLLLERWFRALKTFFYSGPPTNVCMTSKHLNGTELFYFRIPTLYSPSGFVN